MHVAEAIPLSDKQDESKYCTENRRVPSTAAVPTMSNDMTPNHVKTKENKSMSNDVTANHAKTNVKKHLQILLTEDNIINQRVIATQLRRLGNTVHVANHGLEALHFLQRTTLAAGCPLDSLSPTSPVLEKGQTGDNSPPIPLDIMLLDQVSFCYGLFFLVIYEIHHD